MLDLNEALAVLNKIEHILPLEEVPLTRCNGRVLAADIYSDIDMPPFDKSAMDGFACRKADLKDKLRIIDVVHAGEESKLRIEPGTCIKIMTGAPVPPGADTVIMIEDTESVDINTIRFTKSDSKTNICYRGEDVKKGDLVLKNGTLLLPHHIAVLASAGMMQVKVFTLPKIAIISTGSELVEPGVLPEGSQIRNSNAYNLLAQLDRMRVNVNYVGISKDDPEILTNSIQKSLTEYDLLILTGGASVGEHDYIPQVLKDCGMDLHFNKLSIQPGKPVVFASGNEKYCFGLSGNPVSSYLQFELLVKPFIYQLMNHNFEYPLIVTPLTERVSRKKADRLKFFPVRLTTEKRATEIHFNGSAHIAGLRDASGFGLFPIDRLTIDAGENIEVLLIK